jgi:Protein of unknown function (DUF 659)
MSAELACSIDIEPVGDDDVILGGHSLSDAAADEVAAPSSDAGGDVVVEDGYVGRKKLGRQSSSLWELFTRDDNPHQHKSVVCKHCRIVVNYHKQSEYAQSHLNKCQQFRKLMNGMEQDERPGWSAPNKKAESLAPSAATSSTSLVVSRQGSMKEFAIPPVSKQEKYRFQQNMALHYYNTGTSFQRVADVHLKAAIKALRPDDNLLPNRRQLSSSLLDSCHEGLQAKVDKRVNGATACLTTDAWSNVKNDSVINYMAVLPCCSLFLESVSTGQQGHDHKFIADDIARVFRRHKSTIFAAAVTDNTATNMKAWAVLRTMFPSCYFQGCCSHGLHLFVKDVFAVTETRKAGREVVSYPE